MNYTIKTLGQICDETGGIIRTGPFGSQLHESDYLPTGLPVVMPKNILDGKINTSDIAFIGEEDERRLQDHKLHEGDIVYGRRGDIGRRAYVGYRENGWLCGTGCIRISVGINVIDSKFLYYYLGDPSVIAWIRNQAIGATLPNLNASIIKSIRVRYPSLDNQRKIADILTAFDDLIENNTRRIQILEEMAQAVYREWFVHFRFPGHEAVRMVESQLGLIPEGWEITRIGEAFVTLGGGTPSTKNPENWENGEINWFTPTDLTKSGAMFISNSEKKISPMGLNNSSARLFPPYSVMMTSRATIGVVALNTTEACTNQGFIICIPNDRFSAYEIYYWILANKEKIISIASGATYKEISRSEFRDFYITIPTKNIHDRFNLFIEPIAKQIEILTHKNIKLRQQRDLLLPRLMSGALNVENIPSEAETQEG